MYTPENSGLPDENVLSVLAAPDGRLWVGTRFKGLALLDGGSWQVFTPPAPQPKQSGQGPQAQAIYDLALDSSGVLWVGTKVHGLLRFDGTGWTRYDTVNSDLPDNYAWSVVADEENRIWVGTRYGGVGVFDGMSWTVYNTRNSPLPSDDVGCLALDSQQRMWIGTRRGLALWDRNQWSVFTAATSPLPYDYIEAAAVDDKAGAVWLGTFGGGLVRYDGRQWQVFTRHNSGLPSDSIYSLSVSPDGIVWVGTFSAGLAVFDGVTWQVFNSHNSPIPHDLIYQTGTDRNGATWVATTLGLACYRRTSDASASGGCSVAPATFVLLPNTPNPFRHGTLLRFRMESAAEVELGIFDVEGRRVRALVKGLHAPGAYAVWWDGCDEEGWLLPAGVYLACMRAGGYHDTVRMIRGR